MVSERLVDLIEWSDGTSEYLNNLLKKISAYKNIIIFGAGIGGRQTFELLKEHGEEWRVKAFSDNNKNKIGGRYMGLPVIEPVQIKTEFMTPLILVSSTAFDTISKQLREYDAEYGGEAMDIYYFQPAGISLNENIDMEFIKKNISEFDRVYQQLEDEKSKIIYINILNYRVTKNERYLSQLQNYIDGEQHQYFDKALLDRYIFDRDFVDAGAYTGDTMESFFWHYPQWLNGHGQYICFEAANHCYRELCKKAGQMKSEKIIPFNYAVWDREGKLRFDTDSFDFSEGGRVGKQGSTISCCSLDQMIGHRTVSFIKMDIEGAEKRALLGARQIIKRDKPIMAICVYHKPEDLFEIPILIGDMIQNEYKFYLRQYRYGQSETVLYAMPENRRKTW